ncbi:putative acylesterase/phospholipase RssA [Bradyrhizobium diazoefficiens]
MNFQPRSHLPATQRRLPFDCIALLLQGGGALGAYQAGVYEALAEAGIHPDWVAGISIGAINAAIIAGNPAESRVDRLRDFWTRVTSTAPWDWAGNPFLDARSENARNILNQMSAGLAAACGANGFFSARPLLPWLHAGGTTEATSFYDTVALKSTLELPGNLPEVVTRQKEIQYSSRTRASTDQFKHVQRLRRALTTLLDRIPEELREHEDVKLLNTAVSPNVYNIVHLIYRARNHEGHSKDYEFSRLSMQDHWRAGYHDALRTLRHPEVLARPVTPDGVFTFDLEHDGRE